MDRDIRQIRCFVAIAHEGSFTRAAARLRMSQPTLSLQIKDLERRTGLSLLLRSTRRVELTPDGAALLPHAERLIQESNHLQLEVETLRKRGQGVLKLGAAFYTIDIPERIAIIEGFMAKQPTAHLDIQTRWQVEIMEAIGDHRLDLALVIGRCVEEDAAPLMRRGELVIPSELKSITLRSERIELLVPKELPLSSHDAIPLEALTGVRVALLGNYHGEGVVGPMRNLLVAAKAIPVAPPEGNAVAVERYGRQFRIPAMTLGWFGKDPRLQDMVRKPIVGFETTTELRLVTNSNFEKPIIRRFWSFVERWAAARGAEHIVEIARRPVAPSELVAATLSKQVIV